MLVKFSLGLKFSYYVRCTFMTCTNEMKCLMIRGADFLMDTKAGLLGSWSENVISIGLARILFPS